MPRHARTLSETQIYHVVIKGADRQLLFIEEKDYGKYLEFLKYYKEECEFQIFAYCLMSNHIHLLIRHSDTASLETIFRRINTAYCGWFNHKYDRTGHVQDGRFFSEPVNDYQYLINVLRYIHYNPTKAGLEEEVGASYPWSSIHEYLNGSSTITDISFFFELTDGVEEFFKNYRTPPTQNCADINFFRRRLPDDVAMDYIREYCKCASPAEFQKMSLTKQRECLKLLQEKGLSIRQLNRLTGTPKGVIERMIHQKPMTRHRSKGKKRQTVTNGTSPIEFFER